MFTEDCSGISYSTLSTILVVICLTLCISCWSQRAAEVQKINFPGLSKLKTSSRMSKPDLGETLNMSRMPVDLLSLPLQHRVFPDLLVGKIGIDGAGDVPGSFFAPEKKVSCPL